MNFLANLKALSENGLIREVDRLRKDENSWGFERWREIGKVVTKDFNAHGSFFNTEQGLFFFDSNEHRVLQLSKGDSDIAAALNRHYGINPKEHGYGRVFEDLITEAHSHGKKVDLRRLAHYDTETGRLFVSRFNGEVYRLDGDSIGTVSNGTEDVFFFDDRTLWEPFEYLKTAAAGEFDQRLIDSVNFTDSTLSRDEQRILLKLWILALFFGSIQPTKIILLLLGEHGSGKTSALRRIQKFIFGPKADLLSIEKDKQDGFVATVTTDPLALFDNLDERIHWLPYALSRLATGVTFSRRVLYTTNDKAQFPGVSWLGITARTVDFMEHQPDLPDRTLVLELERLNKKRPEGELIAEIAGHRNLMWSELLTELNAIVRQLREHPEPIRVNFRMADFAAFCLRVADSWGKRAEVEAIFAKLEAAQADLVFEDDPIDKVLAIWFAAGSNAGREMSAGDLYGEWSYIAKMSRIAWPFADSRGLARRLRQVRHALTQRFDVQVDQDSHRKQNLYRFWPKGGRPVGEAAVEEPKSEAAVASDADPAGNAGTAG